MATATLKAKLIEDICTKRIESLKKQDKERSQKNSDQKNSWIRERLSIQKKRGFLFWKYKYYPTETEVEVDYHNEHIFQFNPFWSFYDTFYPQVEKLEKIASVARESIERGNGKITLNEDEVRSIRYANTANGDDIQRELEAA